MKKSSSQILAQGNLRGKCCAVLLLQGEEAAPGIQVRRDLRLTITGYRLTRCGWHCGALDSTHSFSQCEHSQSRILPILGCSNEARHRECQASEPQCRFHSIRRHYRWFAGQSCLQWLEYFGGRQDCERMQMKNSVCTGIVIYQAHSSSRLSMFSRTTTQ